MPSSEYSGAIPFPPHDGQAPITSNSFAELFEVLTALACKSVSTTDEHGCFLSLAHYLRSSAFIRGSLNDGRRRDRDDELPARLAERLLLLEDLILQVPDEQQQVVRLLLRNGGDVEDRVVQAGHELPVLVDVLVHDELDQVRPRAQIRQHRAALGAGAVRGDALPVLLEPRQDLEHLPFDRLDARRERLVVRTEAVDADLLFLGK